MGPGGIKSSMKSWALSSDTLVSKFAGIMSVLLPTKTQQNLSVSSSGTGALSLNSDHHLVSASSVDC